MSELYYTSSAHCHSTLCDGNDSLQHMAQVALYKGVKTLGFTGHAYVDFDPEYCMSGPGTEDYVRQLAALKQQYAGKMDILCGIEWDLYSEPVEELPGSLPAALCEAGETSVFAYVIGSSHYIRGYDGSYYPIDATKRDLEKCIEQQFAGDALAMAEQYFRNVAEVANTVRPEILGHLDLIKKLNADGQYFDENSPRYLAAAEQALLAARENGCLLEINTGAIYRGYRKDVYPGAALLARWQQMGGEVIFTADAHDAQSILHGYDKAARAAMEAGYEQVRVLTKDGFVPCAL